MHRRVFARKIEKSRFSIFGAKERKKKKRKSKEGRGLVDARYNRGLKMARGNSFLQFLSLARAFPSSVGMYAIMEGRDARRN